MHIFNDLIMYVCGKMEDNIQDNDVTHSYAYKAAQSSLVSRNITILGRRTSIRLEPEMWTALNDIAKRERCSIHDICGLVYTRKKQQTSLTAAIRVFLILYYRASSTEQGHKQAGHGDFSIMKKRARIPAEYEGYFERSARNKKRQSA